MGDELRLNLACGEVVLEGWQNLDYDPRVEGVVDCDLLGTLPFEDDSVDEILTSHFLEHLRLRTEAVPFLQECQRVLRPGGILSIITPDFEMLHKVRVFDYHFNQLRGPKQQMRWLVGGTFGEGRTNWDYHASGWFKERYAEMGRGEIIVDPAAGDPITVWTDMELVRIMQDWRPHSPFEITAIYRKKGSDARTQPTWLEEPKVVGAGFKSGLSYTLDRLPLMLRNTITR